MSKKIKPCGNCGSTDRYPAKGRIGRCRPCTLISMKDRAEKDKKGKATGYHTRREENMLNPEWRVKHLWSCARNRAKSKGREFSLEFEQVWSLWVKQEGKCSVSGLEFDLRYVDKGPNPRGPSLDRIDSEKGYTSDNIRLVTYHVNTALSSFGEEALISLCKNILENN